MESAELLFTRLESREPLVVDEVKQTFHTLFNKSNFSCVVSQTTLKYFFLSVVMFCFNIIRSSLSLIAIPPHYQRLCIIC